MVLADTMAIFLVVIGLLISFNAVWLFCQSLWGPLVTHARDAHRDGMLKSFFLGLPLTALTVVVFGALTSLKQGPWGLIGLVLAGVFLLFASIGVAAMAGLIGERLGRGLKVEGQPVWKETFRGGVVLSLSFLFPFLGWLVVMPVSMVIGCGVTIRAIYRERKVNRLSSPKKSKKTSAKVGEPLVPSPSISFEDGGDAIKFDTKIDR